MPMVYTITPASPGNLTTNATPATETDAFFVKAGTRNVALQSVYVIGKGAGLTAISGIAFRVAKFATASTAGTAITPVPKDPGTQAAKCTSASRPTAGATRSNQVVFGCGAAGPGGWVAPIRIQPFRWKAAPPDQLICLTSAAPRLWLTSSAPKWLSNASCVMMLITLHSRRPGRLSHPAYRCKYLQS